MIIEAEVSDAVTGTDTFRKEAGRQTFAALSELGVCERAGARDHAYFLAVKIHGPVQTSNGCKRHVHDLT
jgi:hypothetical protein